MQNTRRYFLKTSSTLIAGMLFLSFQKFHLEEGAKEDERAKEDESAKEEDVNTRQCTSRFCRHYKNGRCQRK